MIEGLQIRDHVMTELKEGPSGHRVALVDALNADKQQRDTCRQTPLRHNQVK